MSFRIIIEEYIRRIFIFSKLVYLQPATLLKNYLVLGISPGLWLFSRNTRISHQRCCIRECSFDIVSSSFFLPRKVWSMLHQGSVGASWEENKRNITLTLTLNLVLPSIIFHNKTCVFMMVLQLCDFYGFSTVYFLYEDVLSVGLDDKNDALKSFAKCTVHSKTPAPEHTP